MPKLGSWTSQQILILFTSGNLSLSNCDVSGPLIRFSLHPINIASEKTAKITNKFFIGDLLINCLK